MAPKNLRAYINKNLGDNGRIMRDTIYFLLRFWLYGVLRLTNVFTVDKCIECCNMAISVGYVI